MLAGDHGSVVPDEALQAVQSRPIRQHHRPSVISHVPPGGLYVVEQLLNGYLQATGEGSQNTADAAARGLCPPPGGDRGRGGRPRDVRRGGDCKRYLGAHRRIAKLMCPNVVHVWPRLVGSPREIA